MTKYFYFYFNKYILRLTGRHRYFFGTDFGRKVVWFRVTKVGSRTIKSHFERHAGSDFVYSSPAPYLPWMYRNFYKFTFVREPLDRFVSCWRNKVIQENYFHFPDETWEEMKDISKFISWVETLDVHNCDEHLRLQSEVIDVPNMDFIGRFENFSEDFKTVLEAIGMDPSGIEHRNKSGTVDPGLDAEDMKRIKNIYREDFENFYPELWENDPRIKSAEARKKEVSK